MSDWQVGDLALCVNVGLIEASDVWGNAGNWLVKGRVYQVLGVQFGSDSGLACELLHLWVGERTAAACRFIKVTPPSADAFDLSVIEQMTGAPVEVGA